MHKLSVFVVQFIAFVALTAAQHKGTYQIVFSSYDNKCAPSMAYSVVISQPASGSTPSPCKPAGNTGTYSQTTCSTKIVLPNSEDGWIRTSNYTTMDCQDKYNPAVTIYTEMFACVPDSNNISHYYTCGGDQFVYDNNCGPTFHCGGACEIMGKSVTYQCINGQFITCLNTPGLTKI